MVAKAVEETLSAEGRQELRITRGRKVRTASLSNGLAKLREWLS